MGFLVIEERGWAPRWRNAGAPRKGPRAIRTAVLSRDCQRRGGRPRAQASKEGAVRGGRCRFLGRGAGRDWTNRSGQGKSQGPRRGRRELRYWSGRSWRSSMRPWPLRSSVESLISFSEQAASHTPSASHVRTMVACVGRSTDGGVLPKAETPTLRKKWRVNTAINHLGMVGKLYGPPCCRAEDCCSLSNLQAG